jgi:SAM-dependent methyltransferase
MAAAVKQLRRSLRPGGILLMTVPGITPVRPGRDYSWHWSVTEDSLPRLLAQAFDPAAVSVETFGNLFAATAFLHGAAVEEIPAEKLDSFDPAYPVTVAARAVA